MERRFIASTVLVLSIQLQIPYVKCLREQTTSKPTPSWVDDKNATLLDVFGEVAKDVLINQMIPDTEASCDWHWMHLRCEPYCSCSFQPLWGDYHLGRSCRARVILEEEEVKVQHDSKDNNDEDSTTKNAEITEKKKRKVPNCELPPDTIAYKGMNGAVRGVKFIWRKINLRRRVENAKYKVCDSFFKVDIIEGDILGANETDNDGGILEKPVRALRRSLHCDMRRSDDMNNVDKDDIPTIKLVGESGENSEEIKDDL